MVNKYYLINLADLKLDLIVIVVHMIVVPISLPNMKTIEWSVHKN